MSEYDQFFDFHPPPQKILVFGAVSALGIRASSRVRSYAGPVDDVARAGGRGVHVVRQPASEHTRRRTYVSGARTRAFQCVRRGCVGHILSLTYVCISAKSRRLPSQQQQQQGLYDTPTKKVLGLLQWMEGSVGKKRIGSKRGAAIVPAFHLLPLK